MHPPRGPAAHRGKTRLERRGAPAFSTLLEVLGCNRWRLHMNVACSVDAILAGRWVLWLVFAGGGCCGLCLGVGLGVDL